MTNRKSQNFDVVAASKYAPYAAIIVAQAKHESANFTSAVYKANNNPFGMKVPSIRKFLGSVGTKAPDGGYYARYDSDTTAFKDFLIWLTARRFPVDLGSVEAYATALKAKGYFGDTVENYIRGIKRWL